MTVTLSRGVEDQIQRLVESGDYADAEAVITDALELLIEHQQQIDALRAKLQVGIDQADRGEVVEWTPELREQIRASARRRAAMGEKPDPDVCP